MIDTSETRLDQLILVEKALNQDRLVIEDLRRQIAESNTEIARLTRRCMAGFHLATTASEAVDGCVSKNHMIEWLRESLKKYNKEIEGL